jgi:hypothetical protein
MSTEQDIATAVQRERARTLAGVNQLASAGNDVDISDITDLVQEEPEPALTPADIARMDEATINERWPEVSAALAAGDSPVPDSDAAITWESLQTMSPEEHIRRKVEVDLFLSSNPR